MDHDEPRPRRYAQHTFNTRRRHARAAVVLLVLALVAAACGDDDDSPDSAPETTVAPTDDTAAPGDESSTTVADPGDETTTTGAPESDVDSDGVLRIGAGLVFPGGIHLDPTISQVNADRTWMRLVFGTLLRWTEDARIEAWMAESFEVIDPQTMTITLREGITFTDGSVFDAEAVRATMLRTLNESTETTVASLSTAFKAITDITVDDPLNLTITLSTPQAGELAQALTEREGVVLSPAQLESAPGDIDTAGIGAGPFIVEEFVDAQTVLLTRNADFWDAASWQLGGIEYINVTDGASMTNGLLSGDLDLIQNGYPTTEAPRLEGDDSFVVRSVPNDRSYIALLLCSGKPPFDDPDVRRALQVGFDREVINELAFEGLATPAVGLWPEGHAYYNPALEDIVTFDPDLAQELLGGETVSFDLNYIGVVAGHDTVSTVLQGLLGDVGFDVSVVATQDPVAEFIEPQNAGALLVPGSRTGVDKYNRVFAPGQQQALCGVDRPDVIDPLLPASALVPGDTAAADLFHAAELTVAENAYLIPILWQPSLIAYNSDRVGGDAVFNGATSEPIFETFYVRTG